MPRGATPGRNLGKEVAAGYGVACWPAEAGDARHGRFHDLAWPADGRICRVYGGEGE